MVVSYYFIDYCCVFVFFCFFYCFKGFFCVFFCDYYDYFIFVCDVVRVYFQYFVGSFNFWFYWDVSFFYEDFNVVFVSDFVEGVVQFGFCWVFYCVDVFLVDCFGDSFDNVLYWCDVVFEFGFEGYIFFVVYQGYVVVVYSFVDKYGVVDFCFGVVYWVFCYFYFSGYDEYFYFVFDDFGVVCDYWNGDFFCCFVYGFENFF